MAKQLTIDDTTTALENEALMKQVATARLAGSKVSSIAKELGVTPYRITKVMNTDEYRDHLKEVTENLVGTAANTFKGALSELVPEAIEVLKQSLRDGNLEGVKLVMKALGMDKNEQQVQSGSLTVVLPSTDAAVKDYIEVDAEVN